MKVLVGIVMSKYPKVFRVEGELFFDVICLYYKCNKK